MAIDKSWLNTTVVHGGNQSDRLPEGARTDADIDELFERAFARAPDSEFLSSIHTWWEETGFLTGRQFEALSKFAGEE